MGDKFLVTSVLGDLTWVGAFFNFWSFLGFQLITGDFPVIVCPDRNVVVMLRWLE